ncbi:hypothetical protein AAG917_015725 [Enterobacter hormaechei]
MMHGEHFDARVLGAYASLEDKNLNGDFDTASAGFALADITIGNMKSKDLLRAEMRNKLAVANATGSLYGGGNDIYGLNANAAATGEQYGGSVAAGKEGTLYGGVSGDVTIGTAEAKAVLEVYTGNDGKYGLTADAGAEAKGGKAKFRVTLIFWASFPEKQKSTVALGLLVSREVEALSGTLKIIPLTSG